MSITDILKSNEPQGLELKISKILAGIGSVVPQGTTLPIDGQTLTVDQTVKQLQSYEGLYTGPRETRASLAQMVDTRKEKSPEVRAFLQNLHYALMGVLGAQSTDLEKLGFPPRKKASTLTSAQKVRRAAKAQLTRELRHTQGPKQEAAVKAQGEPTVVVGPDHVTVNPAATNGGSAAQAPAAGSHQP